MATLQGTDRSPYQAVRKLSDEQKKDMTDRQKEFYQERVQAWREFRNSPVGDACMKLAEAKMAEVMEFVTMTAFDASRNLGLPPSEVIEIRAEFRGQYKVWYDILHESDAIFEALARMQVEEATRTVAKENLIHPPHVGRVVGAR